MASIVGELFSLVGVLTLYPFKGYFGYSGLVFVLVVIAQVYWTLTQCRGDMLPHLFWSLACVLFLAAAAVSDMQGIMYLFLLYAFLYLLVACPVIIGQVAYFKAPAYIHAVAFTVKTVALFAALHRLNANETLTGTISLITYLSISCAMQTYEWYTNVVLSKKAMAS